MAWKNLAQNLIISVNKTLALLVLRSNNLVGSWRTIQASYKLLPYFGVKLYFTHNLSLIKYLSSCCQRLPPIAIRLIKIFDYFPKFTLLLLYRPLSHYVWSTQRVTISNAHAVRVTASISWTAICLTSTFFRLVVQPYGKQVMIKFLICTWFRKTCLILGLSLGSQSVYPSSLSLPSIRAIT